MKIPLSPKNIKFRIREETRNRLSFIGLAFSRSVTCMALGFIRLAPWTYGLRARSIEHAQGKGSAPRNHGSRCEAPILRNQSAPRTELSVLVLQLRPEPPRAENSISTLKLGNMRYYDADTTTEDKKMRRLTGAKSGRPPKFRGPRRPVTVTLPESTLARLSSIDLDRARAIVRVTDAVKPAAARQQSPVDLVEVSPGLAVIVVGPSPRLRKIKWLRLLEVAPLRFLLSIPTGTSIDSLELAVLELLEDPTLDDDSERSLLIQLKDLIRGLRHGGQLSKGEMLFVDTRAHVRRDHGRCKPVEEGRKNRNGRRGSSVTTGSA